MTSHKLANYLRAYRKRSGLSQSEVAYLLGCKNGKSGGSLRTTYAHAAPMYGSCLSSGSRHTTPRAVCRDLRIGSQAGELACSKLVRATAGKNTKERSESYSVQVAVARRPLHIRVSREKLNSNASREREENSRHRFTIVQIWLCCIRRSETTTRLGGQNLPAGIIRAHHPRSVGSWLD